MDEIVCFDEQLKLNDFLCLKLAETLKRVFKYLVVISSYCCISRFLVQQMSIGVEAEAKTIKSQNLSHFHH